MAEDRPSGDNGIEQDPHDVLAADEFAMPSRAPHHQDPHSEEHEAHDVLAADEFAMPTRGRRTVPRRPPAPPASGPPTATSASPTTSLRPTSSRCPAPACPTGSQAPS